jgi:hypothetical protein
MFTSCISSCAFGLGTIASVAAAVLWILSKTSDTWLTGWALAVLIAAFALFITGAHCLDVSERKDRDGWSA